MASTDLTNMFHSDATISQLLNAAEEIGAELAQFVMSNQGKQLGAIVVINGENTPAYLSAIAQRERELESLNAPASGEAACPILGGQRYPYDEPDTWRLNHEEPPPAADWAHAAARGVLEDLGDRRGIKYAFRGLDEDVRVEIVQALAAIIRRAGTESWTEKPPTEQGDYWFWNGNSDAAPYACTVLWSGTAGKCFVQKTDTASWQAEWVDSKEWRGYWLRMHVPTLPDLQQTSG